MKKQFLVGLALALIAVMAMPAGAFAHGNRGGDDRGSDRSWFRGQIQSWVNARGDFDGNKWSFVKPAERTCNMLEAKIDKKIAHYDENRTRYVNTFARLETRLADFEAKAEAEGINTDDLEAQLVVLGDKVDAFGVEYAQYIDALREARTHACDTDREAFKAELEVAKTQLLEARAAGLDAKAYYWNTVRVEVKDIKAELAAEAEVNVTLNI